jgi:hypothetical protein
MGVPSARPSEANLARKLPTATMRVRTSTSVLWLVSFCGSALGNAVGLDKFTGTAVRTRIYGVAQAARRIEAQVVASTGVPRSPCGVRAATIPIRANPPSFKCDLNSLSGSANSPAECFCAIARAAGALKHSAPLKKIQPRDEMATNRLEDPLARKIRDGV